MKKVLLFFIAVIAGAILFVSCEEDNSLKPDQTLKSIEELELLLNQRQYDSVILYGNQILIHEPTNSYVNLIVGRAYTESALYTQAISYLTNSIAYDKENSYQKAWSLCCLGRSYFFTDSIEKSKQCFMECIEMNATEYSVTSAQFHLNWFMDDHQSRWEVHEEEHIKFYFQDKSGVANFDDFLLKHEQAFINIATYFDADLKQKIFFFVWDDTSDAENIIGRSYSHAIPTLYLINTSYNHTYGHEIAHVIIHQSLKPEKVHTFINEGIAVYLDQSNRNRIETAMEALNGEKLSLFELWDNPTRNLDILFPVGGAFIEFLLDNGTKSQLMELLSNQSRENAMEIYPDFEVLEVQFENIFN